VEKLILGYPNPNQTRI